MLLSSRLALKILTVNVAIVLAAILLHFIVSEPAGVIDDAPYGVRIAAFSIVLVLFAALLTIIVTRRLTKNMTTLHEATTRISQGDLASVVTFDDESRLPDEVDALAQGINDMLDNLRELVNHLQKTAHHIASSC